MLVNKQHKKIHPSRYTVMWVLGENGKPKLEIKELPHT